MASSPHWIPAYVGLGSNLGDPLAQVRRAAQGLGDLPMTRLQLTSHWYRNPPMGPKDQPDYVNGAAGLLTQLAPTALLEALKSLEADLGRLPESERWGPRHIDLDLLLHGQAVIDQPGLKLPHPGIAKRPFVIKPLLDIAPDIRVPGLGRLAESVKVGAFTQLEVVGTP
jgi:2-amino-4-hydroxy-6-hydroxymethyldihydropteridine diphosphokinase